MRNKRIIVIGGGPSGMMAAGQAAKSGAEVLILEKKTHPGRKLRITGKGRCNLTNTAPLRDFIGKFGKNGKFLYQAFDRFFSDDLADFFRKLDVDIQVERGGRIFPQGNDAPAIADALINWTKKQGVMIKTNSSVQKILVDNNKTMGVVVNDQKMISDIVIIATGGLSYPATGSTGDGYNFARAAGHMVISTKPSLVPLITSDDTAKKLQGLSLKNVNVKLIVENKKVSERFGEMLFTHYGLTGPIILKLSGMVIDALNAKKKVVLSIDLKPALDEIKIENRLLRDFKEHNRKQFQSILKGLLPGKLVTICSEIINIPLDKPVSQLTSKERKKLKVFLKDFPFEIIGHRSYKEAVVTAGGVELKEINPNTMESKIVDGLFFAGEVVDLDGETGGFNLQCAFSTGYLAGISAAKKIFQ